MRYTSNEIHIPISKLQGFTSSASIKGEWLNPERTIYGIYSYQTLMAAVFTDFKKVFINASKYSVTTSQHQNRIATALGQLNMLTDRVPAEQLAELLAPTNANVHPTDWKNPK